MNFDIQFNLIVGLGNPGIEYAGSRHNFGFMAIDRILEKLPGEAEIKNYCNGIVYKTRFKGRELWLLKPQTFMNLSGESVKALLNREHLDFEKMLVIHDDLDLPLGRMKIASKGSSGGHNGIKSIIENLGNRQDFWRLRLGIGRDNDIIDYVLSGFKAEEAEVKNQVLEEAANAAITVIGAGAVRAMNKYNALNLGGDTDENEKNL